LKTIYTAIFGHYDKLKEPFIVTKGWKYVVFTDQDFKSDVWEVRKTKVMPCGPEKTARYYKIMFYQYLETDCSIWVDGTFIINVNLNTWWRNFKGPFTAIRHPFDNCIYKDAQSCIDLRKGDKRMIERQVALYKALGIEKNSGLIASGILMRRKDERVNKFCNTWWRQVDKWSSRDQIAYGYVRHKFPDVVNLMDWNYTTQEEFLHIPHLNKKLSEEKFTNALNRYGAKSI
jgi:hypothetical protein